MTAKRLRARAGLLVLCGAVALSVWGVAPAHAAVAGTDDHYEAARRALARGNEEKSKRELMLALRFPQGVPCIGQQNKSAKNEHITQDVENIKMRITLHTQQGMDQVPVVMRKEIHAGVPGGEPT